MWFKQKKTINNMTEEERILVIKEIAERMKDVVYMNAEVKAVETLEKLPKDLISYSSEDKISMTYTINFCVGDLQQIIGRERRKE